MTTSRLATICILTYGDYLPYFSRCLESILGTTPHDAIELRIGINQAPVSSHYALGQLCPDNEVVDHVSLTDGVQRFGWTTPTGMPVLMWQSPVNLYKEPMARRMFHDLPLQTEYVVWLDDDSHVDAGWWEALLPQMEQRVDYIGQRWWVDYLPGQQEMIRAQSWYRGVPFAQRKGRVGISFMTGGFIAVRAACLREANFPDTQTRWKGRGLQQYGGDTLLGEIAHQLGWSQATHDNHIKVNVDLEGRHPAPRRGGVGRQFGSDLDIAIV
jgi:hypothetical protein